MPATDVYASSRQYYDAPNGRSTLLDRLLYTDLKTYLVELLMKQDQMSMAASIESRVPFLDHQLVEFAAALPPALKLRGWEAIRRWRWKTGDDPVDSRRSTDSPARR